VSTEIEARARLFDAIEGGAAFWSREINEHGARAVVEKIVGKGYDPIKYERVITRVCSTSAEQILEKIGATGSQFIYPTNDDWPDALEDLACPPIALIVRGDVSLLKSSQLAIVGTRNPTHYGVRVAGDFAAGFVDRGWCITSGGAYGIDAAAHKGALIAEGSTIAVLAAGIDINYPAGHARLFAEILEAGAIVTEVMPGVNAIPSRFLTRNRLIAALSNATLVVEAAFRSGSLRTARDAAELLRPVMAIPGPINSPTSEGCHRLIGERAAEIVTSVSDAVEFLSI
jgi:DNA protecting protein DprA